MKNLNAIYLEIAGLYIKIMFGKTDLNNLKFKLIRGIYSIYKGFILKRKPKQINFTIQIRQTKIFVIRKKRGSLITFYENRGSNKISTYYHISQFQLYLILETVLEKMLGHDGCILHASAAKKGKKGIIFLGKSGAGKSTVIKQLNHSYLPLADDLIILKKEMGRFYIYQTPFFEKNVWFEKKKQKYPLVRIYLLRKSNLFKTEKINNKNYVLKHIASQIWFDDINLKKKYKLILNLVKKFREFYFLHFIKNKIPIDNV